MNLTDKIKQKIDAMSYEQLLSGWRFAPAGDPMFQGASGNYWGQRMKELKEQPGGHEKHVEASKAIGWSV